MRKLCLIGLLLCFTPSAFASLIRPAPAGRCGGTARGWVAGVPQLERTLNAVMAKNLSLLPLCYIDVFSNDQFEYERILGIPLESTCSAGTAQSGTVSTAALMLQIGDRFEKVSDATAEQRETALKLLADGLGRKQFRVCFYSYSPDPFSGVDVIAARATDGSVGFAIQSGWTY